MPTPPRQTTWTTHPTSTRNGAVGKKSGKENVQLLLKLWEPPLLLLFPLKLPYPLKQLSTAAHDTVSSFTPSTTPATPAPTPTTTVHHQLLQHSHYPSSTHQMLPHSYSYYFSSVRQLLPSWQQPRRRLKWWPAPAPRERSAERQTYYFGSSR